MTIQPHYSHLIQWQNFQTWTQLFLPLTALQEKSSFLLVSSEDYLFPFILSDKLRKELSSYLARSGTIQRKLVSSFRLSTWEMGPYSHSSPSLWLCVLGVKTKEEVMFFTVEIKPTEVKHLSTDPLQPSFLFPIWFSQHPACWIFLIILRACSQDTSVFVAQWGCKH